MLGVAAFTSGTSGQQNVVSTPVDLDFVFALPISQSRSVPSVDQDGEPLQFAVYVIDNKGVVGLARVSMTGRIEGGYITVTDPHAWGSITGFGSARQPMSKKQHDELKAILQRLPQGSREKLNRNVLIVRIPVGDAWQTTYYDTTMLPAELKPLMSLVPGYSEATKKFRERRNTTPKP